MFLYGFYRILNWGWDVVIRLTHTLCKQYFVLTLVDRAIIAVWYWLLFLRSYSVQKRFPFNSYICKPLRVKFGNVLVWVWIPNKARTIDFHFQTRISSIEIKIVTETFRREILWRTGFEYYNFNYFNLACSVNMMYFNSTSIYILFNHTLLVSQNKLDTSVCRLWGYYKHNFRGIYGLCVVYLLSGCYICLHYLSRAVLFRMHRCKSWFYSGHAADDGLSVRSIDPRLDQ